MTQTYYEILGIARSSTEEEIKKAYRALAKQCHPDLNPGNELARQRFRQINEAFDILSDRQKRLEYDDANRAPHTTSPSYYAAPQNNAGRAGAYYRSGKTPHRPSDPKHKIAIDKGVKQRALLRVVVVVGLMVVALKVLLMMFSQQSSDETALAGFLKSKGVVTKAILTQKDFSFLGQKTFTYQFKDTYGYVKTGQSPVSLGKYMEHDVGNTIDIVYFNKRIYTIPVFMLDSAWSGRLARDLSMFAECLKRNRRLYDVCN
jgi:curved DNA-binding protein CbpA